jgi:putative lipoprotein
VRLVLALAFGFGAGPAAPPDPWFGRDKLKHFVVAAAIEAGGYGALRAAGWRPGRALGGATAVTAGASVTKELFDRRSHGHFSVRDLVWDAAGGGTAYVILERERP